MLPSCQDYTKGEVTVYYLSFIHFFAAERRGMYNLGSFSVFLMV